MGREIGDGAGPLAGLRVIEVCHVIMGPTCGLVLAELGAEVIKVEPAPEGDRTRHLVGHIAGSFGYYNRSKKDIGIDLKTPKGREVLHRLVETADVLTENFAPGTAERLGMGYQTLSAFNPRLIYCSLKGYLPGPYEDRPALDEIVQFMTGLAYMTGPPGRPSRAGASVSDVLGGVFGAVAVLAALEQRHRTGKGQKVQSALFEAAAFLTGQHMAGETVTGIPSTPMPVRGRAWGIYDVFVSGDGKQLFLGITSDKQWKNFCTSFGREDLLAEKRFDTNEKRRLAHDELKAIVAEIVAQREGEELMRRFGELGLPAGVARQPGELFDDPQLNAGGRMSNTTLAIGKTVRLPRLPILMSGNSFVASGQPPNLGDNTDAIMLEAGYSAEDIAQMRSEQVLA